VESNGTVRVAPRFDQASNFAEGLAAEREKEKWGYIDTLGRMVIEAQFDDADSFPRDERPSP
jgi:hypothetical protein